MKLLITTIIKYLSTIVEYFWPENKENFREKITDSGNDIQLDIGKKYSLSELDEIFDFNYKKSSGIKQSLKNKKIIVLFSNPKSIYSNVEKNNIIYYTGQNTGGEEQDFIFGNKILYDSYSDASMKIHFFKDYVYVGEVYVCMKPYKENGKCIFPLKQKVR